MIPQPSSMAGTRGERVALVEVAVNATLQDLMAEVTLAHTYRNDEATNIEAVYTFPLALDAVLLGLEVKLGERVLMGVVSEKTAAEARYEEAIAEGDAAVMLESIESGLYTLNVGNLLPGEVAVVTLRYAQIYRWTGDQLRFFLPTTVAPRYGASPHRPHQAPEASMMVENRFTLRLAIGGMLREGQFECPSHVVSLARDAQATVISLQQARAAMDRDFILNVKAPNAARDFALTGADGDGMAAIASFQPFFPGLRAPRPLNLAVVVDCSGSMAGESIAQARQAVLGMLDSLGPQDRATIIAFGSRTRALSPGLLPCDATYLAQARAFAATLEADLGGTEIQTALRDACAAAADFTPADIFLITDGEVSNWQPVVAEARQTGHRIFTVGVGNAVSEAFLRGLAEASGGQCELVSPREGMAERVMRHFERMRTPRAKRVAIHWPEGAVDIHPRSIDRLFEGDSIIADARFPRAQAGAKVTLEVETAGGEVMRQELPLPATAAAAADTPSTVARLAAAARLATEGAEAGLATALRYQLQSPWTNYLVVAERTVEDKAPDIPALRKVPQTLAAGWGGAGAVASAAPMAFEIAEDALQFDLSPRRAAHENPFPRAAGGGRSGDATFSTFSREEERSVRAYSAPLQADFAGSMAQHAEHTLPRLYRDLLQFIRTDPTALDPAEARRVVSAVHMPADLLMRLHQLESLGLDGDALYVALLERLFNARFALFMPWRELTGQMLQYRRQAKATLGALRAQAQSLRGKGKAGTQDAYTLLTALLDEAADIAGTLPHSPELAMP